MKGFLHADRKELATIYRFLTTRHLKTSELDWMYAWTCGSHDYTDPPSVIEWLKQKPIRMSCPEAELVECQNLARQEGVL